MTRPQVILLSAFLQAAACITAAADVPEVSVSSRTTFTTGDRQGRYKADMAMVEVTGCISDRFSYMFRQYISRPWSWDDPLGSTDMLYLTFMPDDAWSITAGKLPMEYGSYECEARPLDLYHAGAYADNVHAFMFGATASYASGADRYSLQISQSQYLFKDPSLLECNAIWCGRHGIWHPLWSYNLMEYERGGFMHHLALGNRFDLGRLVLTADLAARQRFPEVFSFNDWSLMAEARWKASGRLHLTAKYNRDVNDGVPEDYMLPPGMSSWQCGLTLECQILPSVRLFALYNYRSDTLADALSETSFFGIGVTLGMRFTE